MNKFLRSIVSFGRKHDNVLFAIGEIGLATGAVIFAVKNTEKYILELPPSDPDDTPVEKTKKVVTTYWPTAICLGGFIGLRTLDCIHTQKTREEYAKALMACQAALAAKKPKDSKKIAQNDLPEGTPLNREGKPLEGDEMVKLRDENTYDQYGYQFWFINDELPIPEESLYSLDGFGKKELFIIPSTGKYFISTLQDVRNAENSCRLQIESGANLYMNDVYKYLGVGSDGIGHDLYMKGDLEGMEDEFMFDLAPAILDYNDGFGSTELMYTINPNRFIYNLNIPEEFQ